MLGRSRRSVTVVDGGKPRNAAAAAVHNLIGREGVAPEVLLAEGRADAMRYGVEIVAGVVGEARPGPAGWLLRLSDGSVRQARAAVLATGIREDLPSIEGLRRLWGRDVVACPYCHGWEARGKAVAVLGCGPRAWRQVVLLRRFTPDVVLLSSGSPGFDDAQHRYLERAGVTVQEDQVARVVSKDGRLTGVEFAGGQTLPRDVLFVVTTRSQHSDLASQLGCSVAHDGPMAGGIVADAAGRTTAANVWVAGSAANPSLTVIGAAGHASAVAIDVNNTLVDQEIQEQEEG